MGSLTTYINRDIVTSELPGVEVEPVVGHLDLVSIDNLLLEDTISVTQTVAPGGVVERRQTVEEASSKTSQATVAEGSIVLLLDNILNAETKVGKTSYRGLRSVGEVCRNDGGLSHTGCNTIDLMGPNDGKIGHAHHLRRTLLDDGHPS